MGLKRRETDRRGKETVIVTKFFPVFTRITFKTCQSSRARYSTRSCGRWTNNERTNARPPVRPSVRLTTGNEHSTFIDFIYVNICTQYSSSERDSCIIYLKNIFDIHISRITTKYCRRARWWFFHFYFCVLFSRPRVYIELGRQKT
jgi:hypothetical protein